MRRRRQEVLCEREGRRRERGDRPRTDVPQWVEKKYKEEKEEDAATVVSKALSWQSAMNECARGLVV